MTDFGFEAEDEHPFLGLGYSNLMLHNGLDSDRSGLKIE